MLDVGSLRENWVVSTLSCRVCGLVNVERTDGDQIEPSPQDKVLGV